MAQMCVERGIGNGKGYTTVPYSVLNGKGAVGERNVEVGIWNLFGDLTIGNKIVICRA